MLLAQTESMALHLQLAMKRSSCRTISLNSYLGICHSILAGGDKEKHLDLHLDSTNNSLIQGLKTSRMGGAMRRKRANAREEKGKVRANHKCH